VKSPDYGALKLRVFTLDVEWPELASQVYHPEKTDLRTYGQSDHPPAIIGRHSKIKARVLTV
jgi:hypothetical protein